MTFGAFPATAASEPGALGTLAVDERGLIRPSGARVTELVIGKDDQGIDETVHAMIALMRQGARLPVVRAALAAIAGTDVPTPDYALAGQLRQWVADHWQFHDDPDWAEVLYGADAQLAIIQQHGVMVADCDDAAILLGSLALAAGFRVRVICVGFLTAAAPFTHTWVELRPPLGAGVWIEGDVTRPMQSVPIDRIGRATAWELMR